MACHSVLVAIITAYLSTIAYGTPINITPGPNNSLVTPQNDLVITDLPATPLLEVTSLISNFSGQDPTSTISNEDKVMNDEDTDKITTSQNCSDAGECNAVNSETSAAITESSPVSTTISFETSTLPAKNQYSNFTAIWQIDDQDADYVMISWSEESHVIAAQESGWKLTVSRKSDKQTIVIYSDCSRHDKSRHHKVKLEKLLEKYHVTCNDGNEREDLALNIKPCLSYDLFLSRLHDKDLPIHKETKLKPVIKRSSNIISSYNAIDNNLIISWEPAYKDVDCGIQYRYHLNVDQEVNVSNLINSTHIEYEVESCTNYSISVWSITDDGGSEFISDQPAYHSNRTENQEIDMKDANISARAINETCLIVNWALNISFRLIVGCGASFEILLDPPSERGNRSWKLTYDKKFQEEMLCHLRPGTVYTVRVKVQDHQGRPPKLSKSTSVSTPSAFDKVTVGLIVVSSLLILILLGVSLYCAQPCFSRSKGRAQSVRWKSSFFGNMGRRRSHPIKLRNLNAVTQRLCSSAGHLLELEFEDLVIIADARRPRDSPIALLPENAIKNRYVNILPYEHNRVPLSLLPDCPDSNYINASYIMGFNDPKEYIATQGPKICTIEDFWRMVWEQNVHIIIMVTSLEERGKPKCDRYWPEDEENPLSFDSLSISQLNETDFETYTLRSFQIKRNGKSRRVKQACLKGWPDFGVPDNPEILIRFIEVVRILAKEMSTSQTSSSCHQPIVVHCSAGVGRTGTFIAVDWLMQEARMQKEIDIFSTILRMRECRLNMVQSEEQYEYIYRCMSHFVTTRLFANVEESHDAATLLTNGNNPVSNDLG